MLKFEEHCFREHCYSTRGPPAGSLVISWVQKLGPHSSLSKQELYLIRSPASSAPTKQRPEKYLIGQLPSMYSLHLSLVLKLLMLICGKQKGLSEFDHFNSNLAISYIQKIKPREELKSEPTDGLSLLTMVLLLTLDGVMEFVPAFSVVMYNSSSTGLAKCYIIHLLHLIFSVKLVKLWSACN